MTYPQSGCRATGINGLRPSRLGTYVTCALMAIGLLTAEWGCSRRPASNETTPVTEIIVGAAADLAPAFEELGAHFESSTGIKVTFSFGSTGTLMQQIEHGAPIDLFAAANVEFVDRLDKEGLIAPDSKALYARGRITIWTRADSRLNVERLQDLARSDVKRVAIANPEHAPYGAAARQALVTAGAWSDVEPKVVFGENVRQAMQFAESGNADVAITALSLSVQSGGRWILIPENLHNPLDQSLAVIKGARGEREARQFAAFINGPEGRPVMRRYGFVLPDEEPHN